MPAVSAGVAVSQGWVSWSLATDDGDGERSLDEHDRAGYAEPERPHGTSERIAAPDSSPFGTKPRAPLRATCDP